MYMSCQQARLSYVMYVYYMYVWPTPSLRRVPGPDTMIITSCLHLALIVVVALFCVSFVTPSLFTDDEILGFRERVRQMFYHGYESYLNHAFPYDELRPLTCDGVDSWGSYSLTLIDALDTLAVMGNYSEFRRVATLLQTHLDFSEDINVSVFETNIRVVGGLLSAHLLSRKAEMDLEPGWPCKGPLLRMAEQLARRILPAFNTPTGMPYGTVNLAHGVPAKETPVTCTACVGTYILEFGTLSRLTGDPVFEETALKALRSLWQSRSDIGLVGNHIDVLTRKWTALDSGIGAGVDSLLEYLVKGGLLLGNTDLLDMFWEYEKLVKQLMKRDDWYMWVNMKKGQITMPVFQSLEAFWPGVQSLLGQTDEALKTLHNYHQVWRQLGFTPEFYNIVTSKVIDKREGYPLRPELIESVMILYQAIKDPYLLEVGRDILTSIETSAWTPCGYASIKDVRNHKLDNRMESFFLSETTKYLYLLFDPDNFLHNTGGRGDVVKTAHGECILNAGGYIFNTEAHPIDIAALDCCHQSQEVVILENMRTLQGKQAKLNFITNYLDGTEVAQRKLRGLPERYNCSVRPFSARWSLMGEMMEP